MNNNEKNNNKKTSKNANTQTKENIFILWQEVKSTITRNNGTKIAIILEC